ncbi:cytosine permease [Komagataeibacter sp. FNDCF1]|uniref:purine-cytosine permease family protein n=1 Tax=Komagataeibacter sp. FNDCF1 TaxID=2878681 RepID=UPI001E284295|nr:cytosine permease [Komagataeibacter sp. FNDCF1]MCE2563271.1 cytosine permease [Komagataeibacter sp. FNDCF1]
MTGHDISYIESDTIYPIPENRRHGTASSLFSLWFGNNVKFLTLVTGSLAVSAFHLGVVPAIAALVAGNVIGAALMAAHAAQGPRLGVPQMIQSRGQFGSYGALLAIGVTLLIYVGYTTSGIAVAGNAIHSAFPAVPSTPVIVTSGLAAMVLAIMGHDAIHRSARIITICSGIILSLCTLKFLVGMKLPDHALWGNGFTLRDFVGALSVAALWQISYAPYVSDYSRYLPVRTGPSAAFWATWSGAALGSCLPMFLGVILGAEAPSVDVLTTFSTGLGVFSHPIVVLLTLTLACNAAIDVYGGMLVGITLVHTFLPGWRPGQRARIGFCVLLAFSGILAAAGTASTFLHSYMNFLFLMLYILIPWSAINLVDYYMIRRGEYDVKSFFQPDGGVYGYFNTRALFAYLVGIIVQIPFVVSDLYTGPVAKMLGGADLSWFVGLAVVCPLYFFLCRDNVAAQALPMGDVGTHAGS